MVCLEKESNLSSANAISICMYCVDKLGVISYRVCF